MYSPEDQAFLAESRLKIASGTLTKEEEKAILTRVVAVLRQGRMGAVAQARKARAKTAGPSGDALLAELLQ